MATTPVEVKKPTPPASGQPDVWHSLRSEMDRLFDRFATDLRMPALGRMFDALPTPSLTTSSSMPKPAIDVTENGEAFKLTAELPGMAENDIELVVRDGMLTLKGEKKQETEHNEGDTHVSERSYGSFARSFALPDSVDVEKIGADFAKGVLTVTMPKKAGTTSGSKKIEVKSAG
ncbi:MAG: Hsp20/alpha crystallin family protein [Proteobacteria bacterium]|nr:Hsp20/alpha crystallin family protein [Pseudomonadota bacterium]